MTVELKPEQERMIKLQLASGQFKSVDDVLTAALSRLPQKRRANETAVARMIEFSSRHSVKLAPGETVERYCWYDFDSTGTAMREHADRCDRPR